jgi:cholestenol delta-isomerase
MASAQDFLGQLWKEYALSDSRYMTSDTLVLCLETMTVVRAMYLLHRRGSRFQDD